MKFKITYRPQQSLWLKKLISSSLAIGLIFNSTSASLASILSEDERYETFEGNNITIDNILEEDKVDVEIEGNTMVNLFNGFNYLADTENVYSLYEDNKLIYQAKEGYDGAISNAYLGVFELLKDFVGGNTYTMYFKCNIEGATFGIKGRSVIDDSNIINTGSEYRTITVKGLNKFVFTLDEDISLVDRFYLRLFDTNTKTPHIFEDFVILEGKIDYDYIDYFEGLRSVGQDDVDGHNIEIIVNNKNLFDNTKIYQSSYLDWIPFLKSDTIINEDTYLATNENRGVCNIIKLKPLTSYTIKIDELKEDTILAYALYDSILDSKKNTNKIQYEGNIRTNSYTFTTPNQTTYAVIGLFGMYSSLQDRDILLDNFRNIQVEEGVSSSEYVASKSNSIQIPLIEPLRSLPNGVKDRIVKRNGQWVVERNTKEVVLGENIFVNNIISDDFQNNYTVAFSLNTLDRKISITEALNNPIISDKLNVDDYLKMIYSKNDNEGIFADDAFSPIYIRIKKDKLNGDYSIEAINNYFKDNPVKIVYQLATPIYEPLNTDLSIQLFEEMTHISNDSNIPATIKVTLDRTINRAVEAVEIAKANPTIANISQARMWSNLLKETINKDVLQDEINSITNIEDLQLERKTATSNVDVYIKSENMLLMSLSTNSITFEDYSGVDDMELNNAINISINSSLPYQLNSYLLSEIENSDKSNRIEKDLLNIKSSSDVDYKTFADINEKLILEDNCVAGNNKSHSVDLKLKGGDANKADIYKTVIKFEAEQK